MKKSKIFLSTLCFALCALCFLPFAQADEPLSGTAGNNLTAFNGGTGAVNNNNWNQMMNERTPPAADFGNCNALVMRCAQPKCATGGCVSMDITYPIVQGCVMSNTVCKKHGDALIQSISAQLVANSTAKANAANASAQQAAAQAAASQSAEQMQQMQTQMQELQNKITEQNTQTAASIQAALDEQKQLAAAQAAAKPEVTQTSDVQTAVNAGVSADALARDQASGQILSKLENAENSLAALKKTMQNTFDYAGCDSSGNNCTGPKRVKAFKQKAGEFFEPYENSLDEVYDALIMAQSLGVDITDIYMMLNGSCNVWGKYLCTGNQKLRYAAGCVFKNGYLDDNAKTNCNCGVGKEQSPCPPTDTMNGKIASPESGGCQLIQMLNNQEEVQQNWLYPEDNSAAGGGKVQVGCASEALDNSVLFRGRKKQATIDIEVLQRMIDQDAPSVSRDGSQDATKYCSVDDKSFQDLQRLVNLKKLPNTVCVQENYGTYKTWVSGTPTTVKTVDNKNDTSGSAGIKFNSNQITQQNFISPQKFNSTVSPVINTNKIGSGFTTGFNTNPLGTGGLNTTNNVGSGVLLYK